MKSTQEQVKSWKQIYTKKFPEDVALQAIEGENGSFKGLLIDKSINLWTPKLAFELCDDFQHVNEDQEIDSWISGRLNKVFYNILNRFNDCKFEE